VTATIKRIPTVEGPIRAVIYVRVSSRNQDIENSSDAQIAECKAYIEKMGWILVGIYIDKAKSGRDDKRPQHNLMVHDGTKQDRDFDKVVMWKQDRYARHENYATLTKAMLRKAGVEIISIKDPPIEGPFGRIFETLLDLLAEIQSDGIAENVKRGTRNLAKQGYYLGAIPPYGYRTRDVQVGEKCHHKLEIDPETSKVVREVFDHALAGKSINYIIRDFYPRGIPSPNGLPKWPAGTISGMLHNLHYAGTIVWSSDTDDDDGQVICPDAHPGIVTKEEFDKVQRLLAARYHEPKEPRKDNNPRELGSSYLMSGIITCQLCGEKVQPIPAKSGNYAYYTCKTRLTLTKKVCNCPPQNSTELEKIVMEKIREEILVDANINQIIDQVRADTTRFSVDYAALMADLDKKLEQNDRRQDRAYEAWEIGTITLEKYRERIDALKKDRERLEQEKAEAEAIMGEDQTILTDPKSVRDHATQLREFLETVEPSEWKPIIRTFVRNVSIGYTEGLITYKIPLPDDDPFARRMTSTIDLSGKVLSSVQSDPGTKG
jgi:DNA invertase Pin-like site-specific DNA recombinase